MPFTSIWINTKERGNPWEKIPTLTNQRIKKLSNICINKNLLERVSDSRFLMLFSSDISRLFSHYNLPWALDTISSCNFLILYPFYAPVLLHMAFFLLGIISLSNLIYLLSLSSVHAIFSKEPSLLNESFLTVSHNFIISHLIFILSYRCFSFVAHWVKFFKIKFCTLYNT